MKFIEVSPFVRFAYKIMLKSGRPCLNLDSRLFYVIDGDGKILINGKEYSFSSGTCFLWQPGTEYCFLTQDVTTLISINFDFTAENSNRTTPFEVVYLADSPKPELPEKIFFEDCPMLNEPIVCTGNSAIYNILEKILFENTTKRPFYQERISALFKECLVSIVRSVSTSDDSRSDEAIETVMDYIHKNYSGNVDNFTLAELVGYHPYYLNKLFLASNGITLHKYVINYRIAVSEQLLLSSTLSIDEIAVKIGFSGSLSFSSSFKKKNGMTPSDFRKKFGVTL